PLAADDVFNDALELPSAERAAFLDRVCAEHPSLRAEVAGLLEVMGDGGFLENAPKPLDLLGMAEDQPASTWDQPDRVGAYRILDVLGQGGMGIVYRAQRDDQDEQVALKVVRPGAFTSDTLSRFRHEAEALGRLHHEGIARIHEAGTNETPSGPQPYFAMELVDGEPLQHYAKSRNRSLAEHLRLLARVCRAVDHAHRKGVVHRDIKPANVLVLSSGQPKVVDFGLARISAEGTDLSSMHTLQGGLLGTLHYMSPEQVDDDCSSTWRRPLIRSPRPCARWSRSCSRSCTAARPAWPRRRCATSTCRASNGAMRASRRTPSAPAARSWLPWPIASTAATGGRSRPPLTRRSR
ncbi:MAG: serine/threonine-protein kinase, partial [Planctomycetota bacterium]|nr:serine/threonine-protein kinase [Planctomycetota bacterium]